MNGAYSDGPVLALSARAIRPAPQAWATMTAIASAPPTAR
jgi:hypothetical protein